MAVRKTRLAPPGLNFGIVWIFRALARCPLPMSAWARSTLVCKRRNNGWMKQLEDDVKPLFLAMILDAPTSRGSGDTNPTRNLGHKNARVWQVTAFGSRSSPSTIGFVPLRFSPMPGGFGRCQLSVQSGSDVRLPT
jgi:hypothetical protein